MEDLPPDEGMCPHCGHVNKAEWQLCDSCGRQLPWAKTRAPRKAISELSTEELGVLFAPPRDRRGPLLSGRPARFAATLVLSLVFWLLFKLFR